MNKPQVVTKTQVSAGGVAYRLNREQIEAALISVGPEGRWQLPKGIVDAGESPEAAAQREVREEAGLDTELVEPLETIEYWYFAREGGAPVRFHKFVHFFLLRYRSGDPADHDHEVNDARWVEIGQAIELLVFENERKVVEQARERILASPGAG